MTNFDDCEYYSCREDEERLSHYLPEAAIEDHLANYVGQPGENNRQTMERIGGTIAVYGYTRDEVPDAWMAKLSESLACRVAEDFGDEFGDPEGHSTAPDGFTRAVVSKTANSIRAAIGPIIREHGKVWRCSHVASCTFTTDEVVAMLGEE